MATRRVARAATSGLRFGRGKPATSAALSAHSRLATSTAHVGSFRCMSSYSSFDEPSSLFAVAPLHAMDSADSNELQDIDDRNAPLRADVRTMGSLLGQIIKEHHGEDVFAKIEELRALAKDWRQAGAGRETDQAEEADNIFHQLADSCANLTNEELHIISRAFTHFLAIANSAESHHRIRLLNRSVQENPLPDKPDSCGGVVDSLLADGVSADDIYDCLSTQQTELVLTAHPTEVNRRVILEKQRRVQQVHSQKINR